MILSDKSIESKIRSKQIEITPFNPDRLGSNSYDLCLSPYLATYDLTYSGPVGAAILDAARENALREYEIPEEGIVLMPGVLYLGSTLEKTNCCNDLVPLLEGKSSIGRLGMQVHVTAGFGDAGFEGHWTLEITVVHPLKVYAGMPVAQIYWMLLTDNVARPYSRKKDAKYANQGPRPVGSQMFKNFPLTRPQ